MCTTCWWFDAAASLGLPRLRRFKACLRAYGAGGDGTLRTDGLCQGDSRCDREEARGNVGGTYT